jgi:hypothetical protein
VVAGLWEGWNDPANGEWLQTCTIITGEPNEFLREIHTRMQVILPEEHQMLGYPVKLEKSFGPVPGGLHESVADQWSCK